MKVNLTQNFAPFELKIDVFIKSSTSAFLGLNQNRLLILTEREKEREREGFVKKNGVTETNNVVSLF